MSTSVPPPPGAPPPPPPGAPVPSDGSDGSYVSPGGKVGRSKVPLIVAGVVGFAIVAALATFATGTKKSSSPAAVASTAPGAPVAAGAVAPAENQAVTVSGTALAKLAKGTDPAIGLKAPALAGYSFDGSPVSVQPGSSPMLVLFVAHWCPHCQREVPVIVKYMADGKVPAGMKVVAVSTAVSSDAANYPPSAWLAKVGFTAPVLADGKDQEAAAAYGLPGYPYFVVLKADGTVAARVSGEKTVAELDEILATAVK